MVLEYLVALSHQLIRLVVAKMMKTPLAYQLSGLLNHNQCLVRLGESRHNLNVLLKPHSTGMHAPVSQILEPSNSADYHLSKIQFQEDHALVKTALMRSMDTVSGSPVAQDQTLEARMMDKPLKDLLSVPLIQDQYLKR